MNEKRVGIQLRLGAGVIDAIILIIVSFLLMKILGFWLWLATVSSSVVWLGYMFTEVINAASPGKQIMGLKIATADGKPAPFDMLLQRYLIKSSAGLIQLVAAVTTLHFISYLGGLVGLVIIAGCVMILKPEKLALHDILAGTAVFQAKDLAAGPAVTTPDAGTPRA